MYEVYVYRSIDLKHKKHLNDALYEPIKSHRIAFIQHKIGTLWSIRTMFMVSFWL